MLGRVRSAELPNHPQSALVSFRTTAAAAAAFNAQSPFCSGVRKIAIARSPPTKVIINMAAAATRSAFYARSVRPTRLPFTTDSMNPPPLWTKSRLRVPAAGTSEGKFLGERGGDMLYLKMMNKIEINRKGRRQIGRAQLAGLSAETFGQFLLHPRHFGFSFG